MAGLLHDQRPLFRVHAKSDLAAQHRQQHLPGQFPPPSFQQGETIQIVVAEPGYQPSKVLTGAQHGRSDLGLFGLDLENGAEEFEETVRFVFAPGVVRLGYLDGTLLRSLDPFPDNFDDPAPMFAQIPLMETAQPPELLQGGGFGLGHGQERVIPKDSPHRQIHAAGVLLAPLGQRPKHGERKGVQAAAALDLEKALVGRVFAVGFRIAQELALLDDPGRSPFPIQATAERLIQVEQVEHVFFGVTQLLGMKRSPGPIGESFSLGKLLAQELRDQPPVTALRSQPEQRGGDLRVEDGSREPTGPLQNHLHILKPRVNHFDRAGIGQQFSHGSQVRERLAVDEGDSPSGDDLKNFEARIVGFLAHELGVETNGAGPGEFST